MIHEEIPPALAGERLDRVVALVTDASRSDAAALVAAGGVEVDGQVSLSGKIRLQLGQQIDVDETKLPTVALPAADPTVDFNVVYDDEHVIVVDKPAGLVVHPGAGNPTGTLVNGLLARYPELAGVGEAHRPGIVHRLDIGTSGLMVVARSVRAYHALVFALAQRDVGRVYRTLVWGHLANPNGVIDAPIGRDHRDPMRMAVVVDGKSARTRYAVLSRYTTPAAASSLECRLESGRTHQIRVHQAIGHPVVGDGTHGIRMASLRAPFRTPPRLRSCIPRPANRCRSRRRFPPI
jgi:23S rRNA pseudouridine1911/1915/1917 synthase